MCLVEKFFRKKSVKIQQTGSSCLLDTDQTSNIIADIQVPPVDDPVQGPIAVALRIPGTEAYIIPGPVEVQFGQERIILDQHVVAITPSGHVVDVCKPPGNQRIYPDIDSYKQNTNIVFLFES